MSTLLRQDAGRIGGSVLRRTQAALSSPAVAEERRRLLPRGMTTHEHPHARSAEEIQQIKEKLFDVLCKVGNMGERTLLQDLALHVNPRPHDIRWRGLRVARRIGDFVEITGTGMFASFVVVVNDVYGAYYAAEREYEIKKQAALESGNPAEAQMTESIFDKAVRRVAMERENQKKKQL
ncbi:unnamed protein product [Alopecurus aequalis]